MRRRLAATLATVAGVLALLAAGGGYAIASGGSVNACTQSTHSDKCVSGTTMGAHTSVATSRPASAGAYAHVLFDSATNTATMNLKHGMGSATVRVEGFGGFCFKNLPFTPQNATASIDWSRNISDADIAQISISPQGTTTGCSGGEHVRVETVNAHTLNEEHTAFFIHFN